MINLIISEGKESNTFDNINYFELVTIVKRLVDSRDGTLNISFDED